MYVKLTYLPCFTVLAKNSLSASTPHDNSYVKLFLKIAFSNSLFEFYKFVIIVAIAFFWGNYSCLF